MSLILRSPQRTVAVEGVPGMAGLTEGRRSGWRRAEVREEQRTKEMENAILFQVKSNHYLPKNRGRWKGLPLADCGVHTVENSARCKLSISTVFIKSNN